MCTQALHLSEGDFMRELEAQVVEGEESGGGVHAARQCMPMEEAEEAQRAALQQAADLSGALSACEEQVPTRLAKSVRSGCRCLCTAAFPVQEGCQLYFVSLTGEAPPGFGLAGPAGRPLGPRLCSGC